MNVGSWLKKQARDKLIVATKITAPGCGFEWVRGGPKAIDCDSVVKSGKVRYIGLSNESPWETMEFLRIARERKRPAAASIQNAYSLLNRIYEAGLPEVTRQKGISLIPYSALAFGHLTGKYLNDGKPKGARLTLFPPFGRRYDKPKVEPASAAYVALAKQHALSPATMVLAFVRNRWFVASTIIGATSLEQLKEDIDAIHQRYPNPAL